MSAILEGKPDKNLILVTGRAHPKLAAEVAEQLGIAIATVKLHVQAILSATGARNRTEVVSRMASGQTRPPN